MRQVSLLLLAFAISLTLLGQKTTLSNSDRLSQIKEYRDDKDLHVPRYIFDSIIETYQKGLSGNSVKEGKLAASSLTITEKGASIQIAFPEIKFDSKRTLYIGANLSGSGDDKFVSISKDGKYQNTVSGGLVFNFFPGRGSANFKASDSWQTRTIAEQYLKQYNTIQANDPFDVAKERVYIKEALDGLRAYENLLKTNVGENDNATGRQDQKNKALYDALVQNNADLILKARVYRDTLIALGVLAKKYLEMEDVSKRIAAIPDASTFDYGTLRLKKFIDKAEKEFMSAPWTTYNLHWVTLKPSLNVTPYKMIDPAKLDDNYADTHNDSYFSLAFSYNYTRRKARRNQFQWSISPTISFSNAQDFSQLKQQTIIKSDSIQINGQPINQVLFTTVGYTEVPKRKWGWNFELPLTLFWNKQNLGLDIAIRKGENNPFNDNLGGRFGVYIPVEIKEGLPVWIEPIIKVGKLGNSKQAGKDSVPLEFWKDNVEFGFNLSVAVPNFKAFSKK